MADFHSKDRASDQSSLGLSSKTARTDNFLGVKQALRSCGIIRDQVRILSLQAGKFCAADGNCGPAIQIQADFDELHFGLDRLNQFEHGLRRATASGEREAERTTTAAISQGANKRLQIGLPVAAVHGRDCLPGEGKKRDRGKHGRRRPGTAFGRARMQRAHAALRCASSARLPSDR